MVRVAFGLLGIVMALVPERVLSVYEELALEEPEECTAESWLVPAIRAEGVVYALASLAGGRAYAWLLNVAGAFGALALLFPRRYLDVGAEIVYEDPGDVAWNDRFVTAVRGLGALLVVLALREARARRGGDDEESASDVADD